MAFEEDSIDTESIDRAWADFQLTEDYNLIPMHCAGYAMIAFRAGFNSRNS